MALRKRYPFYRQESKTVAREGVRWAIESVANAGCW